MPSQRAYRCLALPRRSYYDSIRAPRVNAALTQGLRDFFGAHTYHRTDEEGTFHTLWSGDRSEINID